MACPFINERTNTMNTFNINGTLVTTKTFDFNTLCDFDSYGVSLQDIANKPMAFVRAYVACCMNTSLEMAGQEINNHVINGGKLDDIFEVINKELENSGFFRAIQGKPEEVPKKVTTKASKAK